MTIPTTTYLITGATRGIGLALVELLSATGHARVIAGVRDSKHANAKALVGKPNVTVVEIDSLRDDSAAQAIKTIEASGIDTIDVVIANAGIMGTLGRVSEASADSLRNVLNVNAIAPVLLFAAVKPLLQRSSNPRFFTISSIAGSIESQDELYQQYEVQDGQANPRVAPYAVSKVAINFLTKRIAMEEPWLTAVPIHPGFVATDMPKAALGEESMQAMMDIGVAISAEKSAAAIVKLVETVTQSTHSGRFYDVQKGDFSAF